jgi:hypothetical protein
MAAIEKFEVLFSLVFLIFVLSRVSEICGQLYVPHRKENTNGHVFERSGAQDSLHNPTGDRTSGSVTGHNLHKRSAAVENNITTNVRFYFCHACCGLCKYAVL